MGGTCSVVGDVKGKGNELFKAGKFADAIEAYTSAIDADPKYSTRILVISYFSSRNQRMDACNTLMSGREPANECMQYANVLEHISTPLAETTRSTATEARLE